MSEALPPTPDGEQWAANYVSSNGASGKARNDGDRRLVVLGYITAFAMPLIGFILGIVVATRPSKANSKHGLWIIVISIIAAVLWTLVLLSGVFSVTSTDVSY
jgi:uncharacterized membrane protein